MDGWMDGLCCLMNVDLAMGAIIVDHQDMRRMVANMIYTICI